ncbi:cytochrome C [Terrimonas sp.]|uniref:c-type cytochrome n=1 Tax=Terrimonas sp. TaxID=1914338 RepID=UPI000D50C8A8|nr:c-type cytochrome [Terrimonas sp.]PVD51595.1 cytochrome C [Terrimonas sp.]
MKKISSALILAVICYACGNHPSEPKKPISASINPQIGETKAKKAFVVDSATGAVTVAVPPPPPAKDGKALIAGGDCLACHQEKTKLVGPSYAEVAKKYNEKDIAKLAKKIKEGGAGVWGEIPMAPHPTLSEEDCEAMVKYILTIK